MAHTPGPWAINPLCAQVDCGASSKLGGLLPVAQMLWPTDERSEAETEANARLIAAAPELATDLKSAWAVLLIIIDNGWVPEQHLAPVKQCRDNALRSLAKAGVA